LGFEVAALLDIIDVDLGMDLDSIFKNEIHIEVGHEHSERRLQQQDSTNCKVCRILRMRQSRVMFYREEQKGGERSWETREDARDNICQGTESLSLRPACP
jgi:hypothetical protein